MLRALFGSRSSERILLFLLVNETCYSHQLYGLLDLSLSPIQNALQRLEKGGILTSRQEGKRKIYAFNSDFPLYPELEKLLQKAFSELSVQQRKMYYATKVQTGIKKSDRQSLRTLWEALMGVSRVKLIASSSNWRAAGEGTVEVMEKGSILEWIERGQWKGAQSFRNHFRFTFLRQQGMIALEHLRYGEGRPEFLFHLVPIRPGIFESTDPHLGGEDAYLGRLYHHPLFLELTLKTIGPKKHEKIESIYT